MTLEVVCVPGKANRPGENEKSTWVITNLPVPWGRLAASLRDPPLATICQLGVVLLFLFNRSPALMQPPPRNPSSLFVGHPVGGLGAMLDVVFQDLFHQPQRWWEADPAAADE